MNIADKNRLKAELSVLQGSLSAMDGMAQAVMAQSSVPQPVMGNIVIIPGFAVVSQALQGQKQAMLRLVRVMEEILDKS